MSSLLKNKKGVVHLVAILIVLLAAVSIVFVLIRSTKNSIAATTPTGTLVANPTTVYGFDANVGGSYKINLTAEGVRGSAEFQNRVRYYLVNPDPLPPGWGDPDFCSARLADGSCDLDGYYTYTLGESTSPGNNYAFVWNVSSVYWDSQPHARYLWPTQIAPGRYTIALRIEDVNGSVNENASQIDVLLTEQRASTTAVVNPTDCSTAPSESPKLLSPVGSQTDFPGVAVLRWEGISSNAWGNTCQNSISKFYQVYLDNNSVPTTNVGSIRDSISFNDEGVPVVSGEGVLGNLTSRLVSTVHAGNLGTPSEPSPAPTSKESHALVFDDIIPGVEYFWRVEACNGEVCTSSEVGDFSSAEPEASPPPIVEEADYSCATAPTAGPALTSPVNGTSTSSAVTILNWKEIADDAWGSTCVNEMTKFYQVYLDQNPNPTTKVGSTAQVISQNNDDGLISALASAFGSLKDRFVSPVLAGDITAPSINVPPPTLDTYSILVNNLVPNATHYWRVEACNGDICTTSSVGEFITNRPLNSN